MSDRSIIKTITENQTFATIVGAIVAAILGWLGGSTFKEVQLHDAVTYNNISHYIEDVLVEPGYVSEAVLKKETPFEQIEYIGIDINNKLKDKLKEEKK